MWAARKNRKASDRPLPTRQLREKLMAMINDKGPEESRDTDATYIISPHQSEHLPGPSLSFSRSALSPPNPALTAAPRPPEMWKNKSQRGDKVNKKMACKISERYSEEKERGKTGREGALISGDSTLPRLKPPFSRSYLPYGSPV